METHSGHLFISESHITFPEDCEDLPCDCVREDRKEENPLIGEILLDAGIVSEHQIQVALEEQKWNPNLRFGEILAFHGWVSQETSDFFADKKYDLIDSSGSHPIGFYFREASLLNEEQIQKILVEQKKIGYKFGEIAVLNGFVETKTVDFFLDRFGPRLKSLQPMESPIISHQEREEDSSEGVGNIGSDNIHWIG